MVINGNMLKSIILLIISITLYSCSAEKRLSRIIRNNPQLVKQDTIWKLDTTIVNGVQHDTIIKTGITTDTLVIKEKHLTYKYFNNGKTVYLKGICDTVVITKKIPYIVNSVSVKPLNRKERFVMWVADNLAWIVLIAMGLFWLLKRLISLYLPIIKAYLKIP